MWVPAGAGSEGRFSNLYFSFPKLVSPCGEGAVFIRMARVSNGGRSLFFFFVVCSRPGSVSILFFYDDHDYFITYP